MKAGVRCDRRLIRGTERAIGRHADLMREAAGLVSLCASFFGNTIGVHPRKLAIGSTRTGFPMSTP